MNRIKCVECGSEEYFFHKVEGSIRQGWYVEDVECVECGEVFTIKANFTDVKIEGDY